MLFWSCTWLKLCKKHYIMNSTKIESFSHHSNVLLSHWCVKDFQANYLRDPWLVVMGKSLNILELTLRVPTLTIVAQYILPRNSRGRTHRQSCTTDNFSRCPLYCRGIIILKQTFTNIPQKGTGVCFGFSNVNLVTEVMGIQFSFFTVISVSLVDQQNSYKSFAQLLGTSENSITMTFFLLHYLFIYPNWRVFMNTVTS